MTQHPPQIAQIKNQWLYQQVEVEFPTKESLKGREVYQESLKDKTYTKFESQAFSYEPSDVFELDDVFVVDFHRLTVMFALMQAKRWQKENDQQMIVEFLTQIIYSEPCQLYLGFSGGEPIASGIVSRVDNEMLISDLFTEDESKRNAFIAALLEKEAVCNKLQDNSDIYLEI